jgi:hypothetical protein
MIQVAPQEVPGWLAVCGVLSADAILKLTTRLCQTLSGGRAHLLIASAQRLTGTPARLHLYPAQAYPAPKRCRTVRISLPLRTGMADKIRM